MVLLVRAPPGGDAGDDEELLAGFHEAEPTRGANERGARVALR